MVIRTLLEMRLVQLSVVVAIVEIVMTGPVLVIVFVVIVIIIIVVVVVVVAGAVKVGRSWGPRQW